MQTSNVDIPSECITIPSWEHKMFLECAIYTNREALESPLISDEKKETIKLLLLKWNKELNNVKIA